MPTASRSQLRRSVLDGWQPGSLAANRSGILQREAGSADSSLAASLQSYSHAGHSISQMRAVNGCQTDTASNEKKLTVAATQRGRSGGQENTKGISEGGSGQVNVDYAPTGTEKSSKIVFIQVMREYLDGVPAKPSASDASFAYQDADTTGDFYHVDYKSGEADPYYNGDDAADFGTQGNATTTPKVTAHMDDTPVYDDATFPAGKSKIKYEFRTIAFSAAGADHGTFYGYAKWFYEKDKGVADKTSLDGTSNDTALPKSKEAIDLFCANHGFVLPKP
jgi:hypothetical protein